MDATADTWESIKQIIPHVEHFLGPQNQDKVRKIILKLFDDGLFELMPLDSVSIETLRTDLERCWFSMNDRGRDLWEQDGIHYRDGEN